MGDLILCNQMLAALPYYIDNASLNVYSMEELCYYIENNLFLLEEDFMSEELCTWIEKEMGLSEEADHLRNIRQNGGMLSEFIDYLLGQSGYCRPERVRQITGALKELETKSEYECGKLKADRLTERKRYVSAIAEYRKLLENTKDQSQTLVGNVWHNLGKAYAGLFLFEDAIACFERAYEYNQNQESLHECLYACRCMRDEEAFKKKATWGGLTEKETMWVARMLTGKSRMEDIERFEGQLDQMFAEGDEQKIMDIVEEWKDAYRSNSKI